MTDELTIAEKRVLDEVQQHYNLLASEAKKKHPHIKEACETGIQRVRNACSSRTLATLGLRQALVTESPQILEPFFMGCDSKQPKMVQISINAIQKLILFESLNEVAAANLLNCLWHLMEYNLEQVKILQTITLLLSTNQLVTDTLLARTIVLCFRLFQVKNPMISNPASATIRQLVTVIFERTLAEDKIISPTSESSTACSSLSLSSDDDKASFSKLFKVEAGGRFQPQLMKKAALDSFNFLQDLIFLIDGDKPCWLTEPIELSKEFGLELLEVVIDQFKDIFHNHREFAFLLKEKVCQLVIKFFSPNIKHRGQFSLAPLLLPSSSGNAIPPTSSSLATNAGSTTTTTPTTSQSSTSQFHNFGSSFANIASSFHLGAGGGEAVAEWPISVRLMRIVAVLIRHYFEMLITESEIFLSLLIKSLEVDKLNWQRSLALESLWRMLQPPSMLTRSLCKHYDMKPDSSNILHDIVNAFCVYIQSQFQVVDSSTTQSLIASLVNNTNSGNNTPGFIPNNANLNVVGGGQHKTTPFPVFNLRGISITLNFIPFHKLHRYKPYFLEQLEKQDPPSTPDGLGLSTALACILELVQSVIRMIEEDLNTTFKRPKLEKDDIDRMANTKVEAPIKVSLEGLAAELKELHCTLLQSTSVGFIGTFSILLDASTDEMVTDMILGEMRKLVALYGLYGLRDERNAMLISMCKSSLPANYYKIGALDPYSLNLGLDPKKKKLFDVGDARSLNLSSLNQALSEGTINLPNLLSQQNSINNNNGNIGGPGAPGGNVGSTGISGGAHSGGVPSMDSNGNMGSAGDRLDTSRQIIAVGPALPTTASANVVGVGGAQQGPVMLTSKNLQCMNSLLLVTNDFAWVYDDQRPWYIVLTTLQHLVWILGLKPTNLGVYRLAAATAGAKASIQLDGSGNATTMGGALITNAAMSDLPMLTMMLSRMFECTHYATICQLLSNIFQNTFHLELPTLNALLEALIMLSNEASEVAYSSREPSLFALAKMLETSLVNLERIDLIWEVVTGHLIEISAHNYNKLREWSVDALGNLVKSVLTTMPPAPDGGDRKRSQAHYLEAFHRLSAISFVDIRQKQIECIHQLLQSAGESYTDGWPVIFATIESACSPANEVLVRCAFQCYQFIVADLLPNIPCAYLVNCINAAVVFGSQLREMNVSLTAVGLIWNIADYLHRNRDKLEKEFLAQGEPQLVKIDVECCRPLNSFQSLWIILFKDLSNLSTDERLSVRKSSAQTLFATLSSHGAMLDYWTWKAIYFYVIFPMLETMRTLTGMASTERITNTESGKPGQYGGDDAGDYVVHYTRNTDFKQWCETQVLVLQGITRIFSIKLDMFFHHIVNLSKQTDQEPAERAKLLLDNESLLASVWSGYLEFIYSTATSHSGEVSTNSIKCFNDVIHFLMDYSKMDKVALEAELIEKTLSQIWRLVWKCWCQIGHYLGGLNKITPPQQPAVDATAKDGKVKSETSTTTTTTTTSSTAQPLLMPQQLIIPSQSFLFLLVKPLSIIFTKIATPQFVESEFVKLSFVIQNTIATPFRNEPSAYNYSMDTMITQLQAEVLHLFERIQEVVLKNLDTLQHLVPLLFHQYFALSLYTVNIIPPHLPQLLATQVHQRCLPGELTTFTTASYYIFGERIFKMATHLYQLTCKEAVVIKAHILHALIKSYKIPLCLKYACPLQTTWRLVVNYFITSLQLGLSLARKYPNDFISIWADLAQTFEGFLFPVNRPSSSQSMEEQQLDEQLDVKMVELVRDQIMVYAQQVPKEFLLQVVSLLNRGSIHSPSITSPMDDLDSEMNRKLREDFARVCFQTLLQFSFFGPKGNPELFIQPGKGLPTGAVGPAGLASPDHTIGIVNKLAVASILKRFNDVILKYVEDEQICPCPLPRHRLSEISFVLKALATLIISLKEAPPGSVETQVWQQLIDLYPKIVDCTLSNSPQVNKSIREVLHEYAYLLSYPPKGIVGLVANAAKTSSSAAAPQNGGNVEPTLKTRKKAPTVVNKLSAQVAGGSVATDRPAPTVPTADGNPTNGAAM